MGRTLLLTALVVAFVVTIALGIVPQNIHYQGVLTDGDGTAVPNGEYSITFHIYPNPTGGGPDWSQTWPLPVVGGIFNVTLTGLPIELFEHPTWLGIAVDGGSELTPRTQLVASPYALNAATVQDSAIHEFKIKNGTVVRSLNGLTDHVNLAAGSNVTITPSDNDLTISASGGSGVGGSGSAGQVAFWSDPTTLSGENNLFWDSATKRLGIGTPSPNGRLRVESSDVYTAVIAGDHLNDDTQVLRVNFTGTGGSTNPTAIFAQSRPTDHWGIGGDFIGGRIGLRAFANVGNQLSGQSAYGVHAKAIGNQVGQTSERYGVLAEASGPGAMYCYGIRAEGEGATALYSIGAYGEATNGSDYRYGLYGYTSAGGAAYYGVCGEASVSGTSAAVWANGDLKYSGSLIGPPSDIRLKKNVQSYQGALASIKQIEPKTFQYRTDDPQYKDLNMAPGMHYGLIAQELEKVLPELVVEQVSPKSPVTSGDDPGPPLKVKGIKYIELIPILLQAIKEQQETIEDLQIRVAELEDK